MRDFRSTSQQDQEKVEAKKEKKKEEQANERKKTRCHKSKAAPCSTVIYDRGASDAKKTPKGFFFFLLFSQRTDGDAICDLLCVVCVCVSVWTAPPLLTFLLSPLLLSDCDYWLSGYKSVVGMGGIWWWAKPIIERRAAAPKNVRNDFIKVPLPCFYRRKTKSKPRWHSVQNNPNRAPHFHPPKNLFFKSNNINSWYRLRFQFNKTKWEIKVNLIHKNKNKTNKTKQEEIQNSTDDSVCLLSRVIKNKQNPRQSFEPGGEADKRCEPTSINYSSRYKTVEASQPTDETQQQGKCWNTNPPPPKKQSSN